MTSKPNVVLATSSIYRSEREDCPRRGAAGEVLSRRAVAGFVLTDNVYRSGLELSKHYHDRAYLSFVMDGPYTETCAGASALCTPRTLRYLPPAEPHANLYEAGSHCLLVEIGPQVLQRIRGEQPVLERPGEIPGIASTWLAERLLAEFRASDDVSAVALEGVLLEILAEGARSSGPGRGLQAVPRWLRMAREYIEAGYLRPLSLVEIAAAAGVHRVHLSREFRRFYDCTIGEIVRRRRIEHACQLISGTEVALAEVAVTCGFSDQSHFSATFRRMVGVTPARFRQMSR